MFHKIVGDTITMPQQSIAGLSDFGLRASTGQARKSDVCVQPMNVLGVADTGMATGLMKTSKGASTASHATLGGTATTCIPTLSKVAHNVAHISSVGSRSLPKSKPKPTQVDQITKNINTRGYGSSVHECVIS